MIEVVNPAWFSMVVDGGRYGHADTGVPGSGALDRFAYRILNYLVGNEAGAPALEVMGSGFSATFDADVTCAITGAQVTAYIDSAPVTPWMSFVADKGSMLRVKEVLEGFRYYIGFSGSIHVDKVMGSCTTNLECGFGGFGGRPLIKGDQLNLKGPRVIGERFIPEDIIPQMDSPHVLRILEGPEVGYFTPEVLSDLFDTTGRLWYKVSLNSNRAGIRLEGRPLIFRKRMEKSIVSEGILPGTIQVTGEGLPILVLNERTIGGYARLGMVAKVDHDRLAHLKPKDKVIFQVIDVETAERLWRQKVEGYYRILPQ